MSARQKIEEALKANPDISLREMKILVSDIKPATLKTEFYRIKRKLSKPVKSKKPKSEPKKKTGKKNVRQLVFEYLDKNTDIKYGTLKTAFPDIKPSTLSNYLSTWKKGQKGEPSKKEEKPTKKTQKATKNKQPNKSKPAKETRSDNTELIDSLKKTIAAQEKTIDTMNKSLELSSPEINEEELKGMTFSEVKRIAVTFLKSIKELPTKLKK
jgi:hypothetical protein